MFGLSESLTVALIGFGGGVALGLAARFGRFCTLGALEDAIYGGDLNRIRMWALALAVAISGVGILIVTGAVDVRASVWGRIAVDPSASAIGGLLFGYGMALAGNCGYGALARCGGGDLRSFVIVLVMGIAAFAAIAGPLAPLRVLAFPPEEAVSVARISAAFALGLTGLPAVIPFLAVAAGFGAWALRSPEFRQSRTHVIWSIVAGLAIVSGWWGTGWIWETGFDGLPPRSHTFTSPLGDTILYAMTATAGGLDFAVGSVLGVIVGAFIGSMAKGHFRWEACDDARELGRQMLGACLMGIGGVIALGCSIGQGITAFAMLAWSAPLTLACIAFGAWIGLRQLIEGFRPAE